MKILIELGGKFVVKNVCWKFFLSEDNFSSFCSVIIS